VLDLAGTRDLLLRHGLLAHGNGVLEGAVVAGELHR
jgi:hypothetical protein